jgi:hypothetical protein
MCGQGNLLTHRDGCHVYINPQNKYNLFISLNNLRFIIPNNS